MNRASLRLMVRVCLFLLAITVIPVQAADPKAIDRDHVKVAAVQISGYDKGELPRAGYDPVAKLIPYIDRAGQAGAQLVVFPEYVLGHIAVPGAETKRIATAAKANSIYVIVGCWNAIDEKTFANSALVFDRDGSILGKYNKTHAAIDHYADGQPPWQNPPADRTRQWMLENDPEWIMKVGTELPVFDLDFGKIGIMTCYDGWFPEPARVLSLRGAEIIVWINGRGGQVEDFIVKSIMFQSHVGMITTNQAYGSGTMIGDITGAPARIIDRCPNKQESWITGTIDLKRIRQRRDTSRNFAQRRPDLYNALVAPKPLPQ